MCETVPIFFLFFFGCLGFAFYRFNSLRISVMSWAENGNFYLFYFVSYSMIAKGVFDICFESGFVFCVKFQGITY